MKKLFFSILLMAISFSLFSFTSKPRDKGHKKTSSRSIDFPVAGRHSNIGGYWGDRRGGGIRKHKGIDIFAKKGTPVVAISDGIITKKSKTRVGGKTLWLKPTNKKWSAYYAHLDKQFVKSGQHVRKGQVIGTVGNTGNARKTPSHLHFGIRPGKGWVNPLPYVKHAQKVKAKVAKKVSKKK